MRTFKIISLVLSSAWGAVGLADDFGPTILPSGLPRLDVILPNPGGVTPASLQMQVLFSCSAANLRGFSNPARVRARATTGQNDRITLYVPVVGLAQPLWVEGPSRLLRNYSSDAQEIVTQSDISYPGDAQNSGAGANRLQDVLVGPVAQSAGSTSTPYQTYSITASAPAAVTQPNVINPDGSLRVAALPRIGAPYFCQEGAPPANRPNWACPGQPNKQRIAAAISTVLSASGTLTIQAQLPIALGGTNADLTRCSYMSPLMLYFGNKVPAYAGASQFALENIRGRKYGWPEPNADGYFLSRDLNHNGLIDDGDELFGNLKSSNGFEALKKLDSNGDNIIDRNDQAFNELRLWNDKNGDGVSQKSEIKTLQQLGVQSISLKYNPGIHYSMGAAANGQGESSFVYKNGKGTKKSGTVIDVYFRDL